MPDRTLISLKRERQGFHMNAQKLITEIDTIWENRTTQTINVQNLTIQLDKLRNYEARMTDLNLQIESQLGEDDLEVEIEKRIELQELLWETISKVNVMVTQPIVKEIEQDDSVSQASSHSVQAVIETLQDRFGNPEIAIFAHFERLLSLTPVSAETSQLLHVYDECENHIRSLVALGLNEETFGQVFTPIILSKLPRQVRVELHRKNGSNAWKLGNLREYMKDEIKAREMSDWSITRDQKSKDRFVQPTEKNKPDFNKSKGKFPSAGALMQNTKSAIECSFCKGGHYADQCKKFATVHDRKEALRHGCFRCLSTKHLAKDCRKNSTCYYCKKKSHHSSLCFQHFPSGQGNTSLCNQQVETSKSEAKSQNGQKTEATSGPSLNPVAVPFSPQLQAASSASTVQLQMALVHLGPQRVPVRIFFDTGSSRSYIKKSVCETLNLKKCGKETIAIATFGDKKRRTRVHEKVVLTIPTLGNTEFISVCAMVTEFISCPVQKFPVDPVRYPVVANLPLADPPCPKIQNVHIDVLIGADMYYDFITSEKIALEGGLIFLSSKLGYIVTGKMDIACNRTDIVSTALFVQQSQVSYQNYDIERYWSLEDIGVKDCYQSTDDDTALEKFNSSIKQVNGRYEVRWPWKDDKVDSLPSNYNLSLGRLKQLVKRISGNGDVMQKYDKLIQEQRKLGIIEEVPEGNSNGPVHYIPHHCVIRPDRATTKIRVVYDASSKSNQTVPSLNDCVYRGPVLLEDLCGLLLRFRMNPIAVISDIEKAFLQVRLQQQDRDVTRFLWLKDVKGPVSQQNLVTFRFCRVPFGVVSSPFLLAATVQHHLKQEDTTLAKQVSKNMYVDNVIIGFPNSTEAIKSYTEIKSSFKYIAMNIREWFSNSKELIATIPEVDRGKGEITKVLGLNWNISKDVLTCVDPKVQIDEVTTKRQLLQAVSRVFDPCGMFSPVTITVKILVQEVWKLGLGWDDVLPEDKRKVWDAQSTNLVGINQLEVPRYIFDGCKKPEKIQLHCFCDASAKAYVATVYLQWKNSGCYGSKLVFAKSRLAPIKTMTIPRLELMALFTGTKILRFVQNQLSLNSVRCIIWSDSRCVLYWICATKVLPTFVRNRIQAIKGHGYKEFRYVNTNNNPADLPTRGITLGELVCSELWWEGPDFIRRPENQWPENISNCPPGGLEITSNDNLDVLSNLIISEPPFVELEVANFSSLSCLVRVMAWVLRFVSRCTHKYKQNEHRVGTNNIGLSAEGLFQSLEFWIKKIQRDAVQQYRPQFWKNLSNQLGIVQDSSGIYRCGGRLEKSSLEETSKFPVFLPKSNSFTDLVIKQYHYTVHHAGVQHTLAELRTRYWIPSGKSQVKKVIRSCAVCTKIHGGPFKTPVFPPLPAFRVSKDSPFSSIGIDYLGHIYIKVSDMSLEKVWICLFTCASTRAVHLEVISNLTTDQFLLCLRRFVSIYGCPNLIVSDNAKHFKATASCLKEIWSGIVYSEAVQDFSAKEGISWKFIPEFSPWMGGFYERMVGSVKQALKIILGKKTVGLIELQTIITEAASIVNSRPLVECNQVEGDFLTPSHFLAKNGRSGFAGFLKNTDAYYPQRCNSVKLVQTWKDSRALIKLFWDVWQKHYLASLREYKTQKSARNPSGMVPSVGAVTLIKQNLSRIQWKIGKIVYLNFSSDGICRSVKLRLSDGKEITRPLKLLYPIEQSSEDNSEPTQRINPSGPVLRTSKRAAALKAKQAIAKQTITDESDSD